MRNLTCDLRDLVLPLPKSCNTVFVDEASDGAATADLRNADLVTLGRSGGCLHILPLTFH